MSKADKSAVQLGGGRLPFYRFELAFGEEPQGVGIFAGYDDIGMSKNFIDSLFDALPIPEVPPPEKGVRFECWFTMPGVLTFAPQLNKLIRKIEGAGWVVIAAAMLKNGKDAVYCDDYQSVFCQGISEPTKPDYMEVHSATQALSVTPLADEKERL